MGDHSIYDRGSNRLSGYDYSQPGAYFITIGSYHRKAIFGQILEAAFIPTLAGKIVREEWFRSTQNRSEIDLNAFTLMLNHLHGIIWINDSVPQSVGAHGRAPLHRTPRSLGSFVAGFKSITTTRINESKGSPGRAVWQRNYYDHIIRDEQELNRIRQYILQNPLHWEYDRYFFIR